MNRFLLTLIAALCAFCAFAAGFNTGGPGTIWQPNIVNGNFVGDGAHEKILRVDRGDSITIRLKGDVTITDRVFVGSSTTDQNTGSANPKRTVLEIFNDTNHDITIRSFIWENTNGSNVMFSVWENAVLRIHGNPGARIIIDGNGKVTRNYMINENNEHFNDHPSGSAWNGTRWGLIESTGTLDFENVIIENVNFQRYDYDVLGVSYCNTEDGDCAVIKLNPWEASESKGNGKYYTQKTTTFRNCIFRNIRNMSGGYASVLTTYGNAGKRSENNREKCKIIFDNCEIHNVEQNGHTKIKRYGKEPVDNDDTSAGIIRFRGSWPGDMDLINTKIHDNFSEYDCAGVLWNAIGSGESDKMPLLTIDGCEFYKNKTNRDAGALRLEGNFLFTGTQSKFHDNTADRGGAIQIWGYSGGDGITKGTITQTLNECVYCYDNTANQGGALIIGYEGACSLPQGMNINTYLNGCVFERNTANWQGGAICLQYVPDYLGKWTTKLYLDKATFTDNKVTSSKSAGTSGGGAIHSWNFNVEAPDNAKGCTFINNTSNNFGGSIFAEGSSTLKFDNMTFSGNGSDSADKGGAIFGYGGNVSFDIKTININQTVAKTSGGAIHLQDGSTCKFNNATITDCTSKGNGGGISISNNASLDITSGKINNNHANGGSGGGVYASASKFTMTNGEINNNTASLHGGGVWFANNVDNASAKTFSFGGGSISNNVSGGFGGGVCIYTGSTTGSTFSLTGGSINGNRAEVGGGLYLNGWSTYTVNLYNTNVESNTAYLGGGVLVYNCGLNYKNGFVRHNKAIKRDGKSKPETMYYTNHSIILNNADAVNTDLSGIGGGIYSTNGTVKFDLTDKKFGLYGNLADYGADDLLSTRTSDTANATMQLPNPNEMDVIDGFEVPKTSLFWAEDYVEGDTNFGQKPASAGAGPNKRYRTLLYERSEQLTNAKFAPGEYTNNYIMAALGYNFVYGIIKKTGMNKDETAIIDIYEGELTSVEGKTPLYRVALTGDDSGDAEKHILLHPGTWTVVESKWSWTYAGTAQSVVSNDVRTIGGQPAIVRSLIDTSEESVRTFTFTNTKKANITPNAESIQKNQF